MTKDIAELPRADTLTGVSGATEDEHFFNSDGNPGGNARSLPFIVGHRERRRRSRGEKFAEIGRRTVPQPPSIQVYPHLGFHPFSCIVRAKAWDEAKD